MVRIISCGDKEVHKIRSIHWDFFKNYSRYMKIQDNQLQHVKVYSPVKLKGLDYEYGAHKNERKEKSLMGPTTMK